MKNNKILTSIIIFIILFLLLSGCGVNKINVYTKADPNIPEKSIGLAIYGKDGEEIISGVFVDSNYKKNISVADLSKDICRELKIPFVFSGIGDMTYVQGINALFERDHGPESGWLYSVNGEFQGIGCANYILQDGDFVEWHYTLDLGRDLGAYNLDE